MTAPAIETTEDTATGDQATPEAPRVAALRAQLATEAAATRAAFEAQQTATAALARATEAQAERARALQDALAAAQAAATRALAEGTGEARASERRADGTAQRLQREMDRAAAAVQTLQAEAQAAQSAMQAAAAAETRTRVQLDGAVLADRQQRRMARLLELQAELVALLADARRDNREAIAATRATSGLAGMPESGARASAGDMLLLPGEQDTRAAAVAGSVFGERLASEGVFLFYAPDLSRPDIAEDRAEQVARRLGGDLAQLFAGWNA